MRSQSWSAVFFLTGDSYIPTYRCPRRATPRIDLKTARSAETAISTLSTIMFELQALWQNEASSRLRLGARGSRHLELSQSRCLNDGMHCRPISNNCALPEKRLQEHLPASTTHRLLLKMPVIYHVPGLQLVISLLIFQTILDPSLCLRCYKCSATTSSAVERCRVTNNNMNVSVTITTCNTTAGETCSSHLRVTILQNVVSFERGCETACRPLDDCLHNLPLYGACRTCCSENLCNDDGALLYDTLTTTLSPVVTTHFPSTSERTTTNGVNSITNSTSVTTLVHFLNTNTTGGVYVNGIVNYSTTAITTVGHASPMVGNKVVLCFLIALLSMI